VSDQNERDFQTALTRLTEAATAAGLRDTAQVFWLLVAALAITDRNVRLGCKRETFVQTAGITWDRVRRSLTTGATD
jgi:hypothetical protein